MTILRARPKTFSPAGLTDSEDSANTFPGSCFVLQNLIPKPSSKNLWVPRPAQTMLTNFPGFTTPGFISALKVIGNRAYGMINSGRNVGKDEPFCYNIDAGTFTAITGVTNANSPVSPATAGAWTPPIMELVGVRLIVTHPGFNGAPNFFGWIDLTNFAAPTWNAGNTTTTPLPFVPVSVANFKGRAYFAVKEATWFTEPLTLTILTAASVLTYDDNTPVTALKQLPLTNQLGGIIQSLIVFKDGTNMYQVTGDTTTSDLSVNSMNYATGTEAPLSLSNTPMGVAFMAPDGIRILGFQGTITPPVGSAGSGVNVPFLNALVPSRVSAACNASIFRISVQNAAISGQPWQEYWLHLNRENPVWSGPHTFAPSQIEPYKTKFVTAPTGVVGQLWISETVPSTTSVYTENSIDLQWQLATVMMGPDEFNGVYCFDEATITMATDPSMISWTAVAINPDLVQYSSFTSTVPNTTPVWDAAVWDNAIWDGVAAGLMPRRIDWDTPITTSRAQVILSGGSAGGVVIGDLKFTQGFAQYVPETGI